MHICEVIKDFGSVRDKKSGKRIFGFDPPVGKMVRFDENDYNIFKKHKLIKEVAAVAKDDK